ncbi:MAG: hypothetical protein DYG89_15185 [Caldilinea sp. CFX5]|nr:hypothetical protein [Caldilinea sp. CFX5]
MDEAGLERCGGGGGGVVLVAGDSLAGGSGGDAGGAGGAVDCVGVVAGQARSEPALSGEAD